MVFWPQKHFKTVCWGILLKSHFNCSTDFEPEKTQRMIFVAGEKVKHQPTTHAFIQSGKVERMNDIVL